jgi:A/G-specific adenine glycosylase
MAQQRQTRNLLARNLLARNLLVWYDAHARVLPWRARPGIRPDPYHVWLSEIMLQQTTVATVKAYFIKFLALWPSIHDLAKANREDVMRAWAGLGYYARARNLHTCAIDIVENHNGHFPQTVEGLAQLKGIGPYTAAAIASIAFDVPAAAVDGNVERVISRYYAIEVPLPLSKPDIRQHAQSLVPQQRAGDFAQAMMDLGATICTPKSPDCMNCPWTEGCLGRRKAMAESLPRKSAKKKIPTRKAYAFWIEQNGSVLLRKRPDKGLLGGMLEVPSTDWLANLPAHYMGPVAAQWRTRPGIVEHTFTHFHLELTVLVAAHIETGELLEPGDYRWVRHSDLPGEALPTVMRKVVGHVTKP